MGCGAMLGAASCRGLQRRGRNIALPGFGYARSDQAMPEAAAAPDDSVDAWVQDEIVWRLADSLTIRSRLRR